MYFFKLVIPFVLRSLAALLNISNDTGSDLTSFALSSGVGSRQRGSSIVLEGISVAAWSHGTNTGGRISFFGGVCDSLETVTGVITFSLFLEDVNFDNMGNKEFIVGTFSFKEGTSFTKFPTVEDVREAFLLYHMNIIPMAIMHTPTDTNRAKMSLGIMKMDSLHQYSQEHYQMFSLTW